MSVPYWPVPLCPASNSDEIPVLRPLQVFTSYAAAPNAPTLAVNAQPITVPSTNIFKLFFMQFTSLSIRNLLVKYEGQLIFCFRFTLHLHTIILFILCQLLFIDFLFFLFYNLPEINNNTRGGLHGKNDRC